MESEKLIETITALPDDRNLFMDVGGKDPLAVTPIALSTEDLKALAVLARAEERSILLDKKTLEPCPTGRGLMCTIDDDDHLHVFSHMVARVEGRPHGR